MGSIGRELKRAWRSLAHSPRFTATCVATLALGIGASTAIFSVVNAVLLRPLPFEDPSSIVQVWQVGDEGQHMSFSEPNFVDLRDRSRSFTAIARYRNFIASVAGGSEPVRVPTAQVSGEFFAVLGVEPMLGRVFVAQEHTRGGRAAAIVSYAYWQRYLGGDPELGDLELRISGRSHPVVGVLPPAMNFPSETAVWTPVELGMRSTSRTAHNDRAVARLAPGVGVARASAELSAIARSLAAEHGDDTWMVDAAVVPLRDELVANARPALAVLSAAVGFLLFVACANVINLMLARLAGRQSELSVSAALGASRFQLLRPFLAESMLLSLAGGALGTVMAAWGVRLLIELEPGSLPRAETVGVDVSVLGFALGVSTAAACLLGAAAFMRAWKTSLRDSLRGTTKAQGSDRLRHALVVTQLGLTLVLLVGAGLLGRSLWQLLEVDPGFRVDRLLVLDLTHSPTTVPDERAQLAGLQRELLERVSNLPGVGTVGAIDRLPMSTGFRNGMFLVVKPGETVETFEDFERLGRDPSRVGEADYRSATEGYFQASGIPLTAGRLFELSDGGDAPHVALVSESLARRQWPDGDALGALVEFGNMDGDLRLLRVVGIVGDVRHGGLDTEPAPTIYVNARQRPPSSFTVVVETDSVAATVPAVRAILQEIAPETPPRFRTMGDVVSDSFAARRFNLALVGVFALAALALAVMGVYGIVSLNVSERLRELALRMALGANEGDVLRLVVTHGARLIGMGLAAGVVAAFSLSRFLESLLFEVSATDPVTLVALALLLAATAILASVVPALRAARVDPMAVLKAD